MLNSREKDNPLKRICVTGGAGFIGSNYARYKINTSLDVHIVVFDKMTYAGNKDNLKDLDESRYTFIQGDIADRGAIQSAMEGCDAIVNFAADTHVDRSIMGATDFIATNVTGVYNILEAAKELETVRVLLVSTDEVYGSIREGSFTEIDPPGPRNPYSASKAGGELIALAHYETFGTPVIITRGSNTYGPYQYPEKVMPLFITNLLEDKKVPLYQGGEHNVRDWLYVEDHARALRLVMEEGRPGEVYCISAECEKTNIELVHSICKILDEACPESGNAPYANLIHSVQDRPGHDRRYAMKSARIRRELGWAPRASFTSGLAKTVQWYIANQDWCKLALGGESADRRRGLAAGRYSRTG